MSQSSYPPPGPPQPYPFSPQSSPPNPNRLLGRWIKLVLLGVVFLLIACVALGAVLQANGYVSSRNRTATALANPVANNDDVISGSLGGSIASPTPIEAKRPTEAPRPAATAEASTPTPEPTKNPGLITRSDFGSDWPFTVESGTVACNRGAITFEVNGIVYGVNGTADATKRYRDIRPIWADNPDVAGLKISIEPIITYGMKLC